MADSHKTADQMSERGKAGVFTRLLSWMRGARREEPHEPVAQLAAGLDGAAAVAVTEACVAEAAGLSTRYPATSSVQTFRRELDRGGSNLLGDAVSGIAAADARGALATATGLSLSGVRGTAFVSGANLASVADQLGAAASQHLPLVVHVASRSASGGGSSLGSGHEGYHAVSEAGCLQLFAGNVQEAVDLTLVARRVAELALVPAIVAIDGEQTADSLQEVMLPSAEMVEAMLGAPDDMIDAPTPAQGLLFGEQRRRVPRPHDLNRPAMVGAHLGREVRGLAAAGQRPYFYDHLAALLDESLAHYGELSGRHHHALREHCLEDARIVIVAQGAAVETACAVCDTLRSERKLQLGVIGLRSLRPLPDARLAELLKGKQAAWVLERLDSPAAAEPPLTRELRAALARAGGNAPRISTAAYGLAGHPLRAADLIKLVADNPRRGLVYLGFDLTPKGSGYPKRQGTIEQISRGYPELGGLGVRSPGRPVPLAPAGTVCAGLYRLAGQRHAEGVVNRLGEALLRAVDGGSVRTRVDAGWEAWDAARCDRLVYNPTATVLDPGDEVLLDVALLAIEGQIPSDLDACATLRDGGLLVVESPLSGEDLHAALPAATQRALASRGIKLQRLAPVAEQRFAGLAGGLAAALLTRDALEQLKPRKLVTVHEELLEELAAHDAALEATREARQGAFVASLEEGLSAVAAKAAVASAGLADPAVPALVRRFAAAEAEPDSLPAFWNQIGVLYQTGERDQLCVEPRLAAPAVPSLSSTFNSYAGGGRRMLPVFDPQDGACDDCAKAWTACPEGAIGPVAHTGKSLLEAGMALAGDGGVDVTPLKMVLGKLAPKISAGIKADPPPKTAGELLRGAPKEMLDKAPLPEDRREGILKAFDAVVAQLDALPVARTAALFDAPEAMAPGTGALLSVAINPDACKACGLCVNLSAAFAEGPADAEAEERARAGWQLWQRMPDTPGEVIARGREHDQLGELGALLLSRHCLLAMAGGDTAEPGSGTKVALRLSLAVAEYQLQRQLAAHLESLQKLRDEVAGKVRENLADALPASDINLLAEGIEAMGQSHAKLGELTARVDEVMDSGKVDVNRLKELVAAGKELADLYWRLSKGPHGLGRARLGLAFAPDALSHGIGAFPFNPFSMPVAIDSSGEAAAFARGLLEGQLRDATGELRAMRRARLALANPTEAALAAPALRRLAFADLDADERRACPPLLLVGSSASFSDQTLAPLLTSRLPVKVLLLADGGVAADGAPGDRDVLSLLALGGGEAFVAQCSIAHPQQLVTALTRAMAHDGPALIQLHAPSPAEHGFAAHETMARAEAAVAARLFPLFVLDPAAEGVFGTRIDLSGNPELDAGERGLSVVEWAAGERRFADHLGGDGGLEPSPALAALGERSARAWATLRELAGAETPFTARVRAEAEAEVKAAHAQEVAALQQKQEQELAAVKQEQATEITERVRQRLLQLAGYGAPGGASATERPA